MLKIHLLGKLDIYTQEEHVTDLDTHKVEELLCYLLLNRARTHSRESIADLLWGDINPEQSKNYLRKCLWQLQTKIDRYAEYDQERLVLADSDWIQINPDVEIWLDFACIEEAYNRVRGKNGHDLFDEEAGILKRAIELYRGDLLEGWYQDWCLFERERLQYIFIVLLDKLMEFHDFQGEPELGLTYGNVILRYDRARERTHRRMMRLYYNAGDRAAAIRQYKKCFEALSDELDVEPSKRTCDLYAQIRAGKEDKVSPALKPDQLVQVQNDEHDMLKSVPGNLLQIQQLLSNIQMKLENELNVIQRALRGEQEG